MKDPAKPWRLYSWINGGKGVFQGQRMRVPRESGETYERVQITEHLIVEQANSIVRVYIHDELTND